MPSGLSEKEDTAKLDAAMAIAALSNERWDPVEPQELEANLNSAHRRRGGHRKSLMTVNSSNYSHVVASVMPPRANILGKRKRTGDVSNNVSEAKLETTANHLEGGKFVRSAKQAVHKSLASPENSWYTLPESPVLKSLTDRDASLYTHPESSLNIQSPLCSPELTATNAVAVTDSGVPSEPKQTNGFLMTSLSPLFLPGSGIHLVPVFPAGAFGQSGDAGISSQLIADPHLLQLLCQQGNFLALSIPNSPNPSPAVVEELDNSLTDGIAASSPAYPSQLPGSLSTLRNYYNTTNISDQPAVGRPAAKIDVLSPSKVDFVSQPMLASNPFQITKDQFLKLRSSSSDIASLEGQDILQLARGQRPSLSTSDNSLSTLSSGTTSGSVGTDLSPVTMPGSLNILRSYYSSLNQKTKQSAPVQPSADHRADHVKIADCQSPQETSNSALNLSRHRQGDQNEIQGQGIAGIKQTNAVRSCVFPNKESTGMSVDFKKMLNNRNNGQCPLAPYVLGSASTSLSGPIRILPKIVESRSSIAASPVSSHLSDDRKRSDSDASDASPVHLPPKKRRKAVSPDSIKRPLDECCVVVGDEKVPLNVFMSRLDSRTHQIVINQIQSAIISQQELAATSAEGSRKLAANASRTNMAGSSSSGLASIPNLDLDVNCTEMGNCKTFSIPSSVLSPNPSGVGAALEKKNAQVHAKNGNGWIDEDESHSSSPGSLQLPSSVLSLSESILHPVLQPDEDGDLPLHVAVTQGELRVVEQIVEMMRSLHATIDCRNYLRQTPLHLAVVIGNCEMVTCLLEAGASPNIADRNGQNCFHLSVQYKQVKCLEVLFSCTESRPDLLNYEGMTPLHLAVKLNLPDAVMTLLLHRVLIDAVDGKSGHTALYMAADANRFRVAEILLSFNANVQIASYSGCSPVQAASSKSFHEMVKLLMKYGGTSEPVLPERSSDPKDSGEPGAQNRKRKL